MPSAVHAVDALVADSGLGRALDEIGAYVVRQRWSGAIGSAVRGVCILDAVRIVEIPEPTYFTVTRVTYDNGVDRDYALPLGHRRVGDPLAERAPEFMIGGLPSAGPARFIYDALGDPEYVRWLWRTVHRELTVPTAAAELRFRVFDRDALESGLDPALRVLGVEQSNTSLMLGAETFLKHLRRVEPGPSQELEMLEALSRAGFTHMAPLQAAALYAPRGADATPVVLIQPFLHNGTEGWTLALTSLRSLYAEAEELAAVDSEERRAAVNEHIGDFAPEAERLGAVLAEMHLALTRPDLGDGFTPEPVTAADIRRWAGEMTGELDALLARPDEVLAPMRQRRDDIAGCYAALAGLPPSGVRTRVHGDLHLGQSMRTDSGWIILDFEGEPDRTPAERRRKASPLIDVAGMLRSFDYAAAVALTERILPQSSDWAGMLAHGEAWAQACRDAFLKAYTGALGESGLLPDASAADALLRAFEMRKAAYETAYELGHRPSWAPIPIRFLLRGAS